MPQAGSPPGSPGNPRAPTDLEYERWFRAYKQAPGVRSPAKIARLVGARKDRIYHAIHFGWPPDYMALKDRIKDSDEAVQRLTEAAEAEAVERVAAVVVGNWEPHARRHLAALHDVAETIKHVGAELRKASREATFHQYRRVPELDAKGAQVFDGDGKPLMKVERYIPMETVARATARLAMAAKDHAILNKALLDSLNPMKDAAIDLSDAPPGFLEYIQGKWG